MLLIIGVLALNYNFEANFYGVFSDGRPELALPYFDAILNQVDLGKWRASMPYWGQGANSQTPGSSLVQGSWDNNPVQAFGSRTSTT